MNKQQGTLLASPRCLALFWALCMCHLFSPHHHFLFRDEDSAHTRFSRVAQGHTTSKQTSWIRIQAAWFQSLHSSPCTTAPGREREGWRQRQSGTELRELLVQGGLLISARCPGLTGRLGGSAPLPLHPGGWQGELSLLFLMAACASLGAHCLLSSLRAV